MEILLKKLKTYCAWNEQEEQDKSLMIEFLENGTTPFLRENKLCHFTASSWIVNPERTKVLMVYHNIYQSWSWTGGHADGDADLLAVAIKEAKEETGVHNLRAVSNEIYSIETITVDGHVKRGCYVPSHLHMNVTYLLETDESEILKICQEENSGVQWLDRTKLEEKVSEPWMLQYVYAKLNAKLEQRQEDR